MRRFQDNTIYIHILDDAGAVFSCHSAEFTSYEPTYQTLQPGEVRIWTPESQSISSEGEQRGDPFYTAERFALFVGKLADYQAAHAAAHQPPSPTLADVQAVAARQLNSDLNTFLFTKLDVGSLLEILGKGLKLTIKKTVKGQPWIAKDAEHFAACETFDAWKKDVMRYYYAQVDAIQAASSVPAVHAIAWDFEGLFGPSGSSSALPAINVREFFVSD